MPFINLIQEQRLEIKKAERKARLFFATFVGAAVVAVGTSGYFLFKAESLKGEESDLLAQAQKAQPLVRQIEQYQADFANLSPRLKTLQDAQLMTGRWDVVLEHLTTQTPTQTWLTSMRAVANDPEAPIGVSFHGLSTRQELVGEYILRLQACAELEGVGLKFTQAKAEANSLNIEFEIEAGIAGTAEQKTKNEIKKEGESA